MELVWSGSVLSKPELEDGGYNLVQLAESLKASDM